MAAAFMLRALLPVGYMPDANALRQGDLAIAFCSADGAIRSVPLVRAGEGSVSLARAGDRSASLARDRAAPTAVGLGDASALAPGGENSRKHAPDDEPAYAHCLYGSLKPIALLAPPSRIPTIERMAVLVPPAPRRLMGEHDEVAGPPLGLRAPPASHSASLA